MSKKEYTIAILPKDDLDAHNKYNTPIPEALPLTDANLEKCNLLCKCDEHDKKVENISASMKELDCTEDIEKIKDLIFNDEKTN